MSDITRDYKETVYNRIQKDSAFASALLDEAISLFLNGEPSEARLILRDLVKVTVGFENLSLKTEEPRTNLYSMLSADGNPTMNSLTDIIGILRQNLNVNLEVRAIPCH